MAEHAETPEPKSESLMEKITDKLHGDDSSSSSDSDSEKKHESSDSVKAKIYRLFGREKPVHKVFGGGKRTLQIGGQNLPPFDEYERLITNVQCLPLSLAMLMALVRSFDAAADIFLWRNKKVSAGVLGGVTAIWVLFELAEYHLLTLVCHASILALAILFLWSNATTFINKSPPRIPEVRLPEEPFVQVASALRIEINRAVGLLRDIASGKDLKKFLAVVAGLWVLSVVGNWCNFLTLFYIAVVLLFTLPVFYEKYDDKVDYYAEKAMIELKKQYKVFDAKVLSKIPRGPLKDKKRA
ncbi:hypothetical protein LguiA_010430 [Lonicera macranthoides]